MHYRLMSYVVNLTGMLMNVTSYKHTGIYALQVTGSMKKMTGGSFTIALPHRAIMPAKRVPTSAGVRAGM